MKSFTASLLIGASAGSSILCNPCRIAMQGVNKSLGSQQAMTIATEMFKLDGLERPELTAEAMLKSLKELLLTPDYFCSKTIGVCDSPHY